MPRQQQMPQQTQVQAQAKTKTARERFNEVILGQLGVDEMPLDETSLSESLDLDEFDMIEICMALEEEFEIDIDDGALERCHTIGDMFKLVSQ